MNRRFKNNRVQTGKRFLDPKRPVNIVKAKEDDVEDDFEEDFDDEFEGDEIPEDDDGEIVEGEEEFEENHHMSEDGEEETFQFKGDVVEDPEDKTKVKIEPYIPSRNGDVNEMEEDEELVVSGGAYRMLHTLSLEWSCLSFDIMQDQLGATRTEAPYTCYFMAASTAMRGNKNKLHLVKADKMTLTHLEDESSEDDSEENNNPLKPKMEDNYEYVDPVLTYSECLIPCAVNRVRTMKHKQGVVALWGENGKIYVYDMSGHITGVDGGFSTTGNELKSTLHHRYEGFALDWSPLVPYRLISGDIKGNILLWEQSGGEMRGSPNGYIGHKSSIEDLQWCPNEADVFLSCSCDKTIKLWDARIKQKCVKSIKAHNSDVNVCNWNKINTNYIVSGGDDGELKVWDFRQFDIPFSTFDWHRRAITSVEWCPHDESSFLACSEDDSISFWDISMEPDRELADQHNVEEIEQVPPQLMFLHQGQKEIKEAHWHPQIQGVVISTAVDGMNIFRPCNF